MFFHPVNIQIVEMNTWNLPILPQWDLLPGNAPLCQMLQHISDSSN